jgi:replicative DNA helicase
MLRLPELFDYAKQHLKPQHFSNLSEMRYALLWSAALDAAARSDGKIPDKGLELIIAMELTSKVDNAHGEITPEAGQKAVDLLAWVFQFDAAELNAEYYRGMIQDLIIERTIVSEMTKDMTSFRDVGRPTDIIKSMDSYNQKLQSILLDHRQAGQTAFPKDFKPKKLGKFSTGHDWLDKYMNGGQAPGEVYVLQGPSGLGKTSTAIMITTETGRVWNTAFKSGAVDKQRVSCMFSWEQDLDRLRLRFWSYAAMVDSLRLELYADESVVLSTTGNLEAYELADFKDKIHQWGGVSKFPGERERLAAAMEELNDTVRIFDFSGAAENPKLGEGGLDEVAAVLRSLQKEGKEIGVVVLDYANAAVRRMLAARGEDPSNLRHHLSNYCNECRFKIALPFNCPVWVLNQLNTEANRKSPTAEQHHSYTAECGNFAENSWFAFTFSTKDKVNNTCRLFCTKERRAKGDRPPVILKIEGNYCRMVEAIGYVVDEINKQFIPNDMRARRPDAKALRKKIDQERPGLNDMGSY